jgi:aldose 1-epimerase
VRGSKIRAMLPAMTLSLRAGSLTLDLAPEAGGSVARFALLDVGGGDFELLRRATPEAIASGRGNNSACYPLVPFSGRIANGRFAFDGRDIEVPLTSPDFRHPIHGDGWTNPWAVAKSDGQSAELVYEHEGKKGWPFRYVARQSFRLTEDTLTIRMSLENRESHAVPAGLGEHPFFTRTADAVLTTRTRYAWLTDEEVLPLERIPTPDKWSFATARRVEEVTVDSGFEGWDGHARIDWPSRKLSLEMTASEPFRDCIIYVPPGRPFFCVEPVSHIPGGIGNTRLDAGATLAGDIAFKLSSL